MQLLGIRTILVTSWCMMLLVGCNGCEDQSTPHNSEPWTISAETDFGRMPRWSPGGANLLFGDDTPGHSGIYLWDLETEPIRIAANVPAHNWDYHWSPDASMAVFTCPGGAEDTSAGVWIYRLHDHAAFRIWNSGRDVSWSGDGSRLYLRLECPDSSDPGIYRLALDAEKDSVIDCEIMVVGGCKPLASPAGDLLGYIDEEISGTLRVINPGLEELISVADGVVDYKWSGAGNCLTCIVNDYTSGTLTGELWLVYPVSQQMERISQFAAWCAPDSSGRRIAYSRWSAGRWDGLWLYQAPSSNQQLLTYGLNADFNPCQDRIAFNAPSGGIKVLDLNN